MTSPRQTPTTPAKNEIVVYQPNDVLRLEVRLESETVWLSQSRMGELFDVDRSVINRHIHNIYKTGELDEAATCAKNAQVQNEGGRTITRLIPFYNLDMIIAVGYRVNSLRATRFRQWATKVLHDYLLHGYAINARLNQLEDKMDRRLAKTEQDVIELKEQVGFFVKTALPPVEGVLFEGQIKDAYDVALKIIQHRRHAKTPLFPRELGEFGWCD